MIRRALQFAFLCSVPLSLCACGADGTTTPIRVCGTIDSADMDVLQVRVSDAAGREVLTAVIAAAAVGEPIALPVEAEIPTSEGTGLVSVEGRSDGLLAVRYTLRVRDLAAIEPLSFPLDAECQYFDCPEGETCIGGECALALVPERSRPCP